MPTDFPSATRPLPDRPNLRHLKDQAKNLLKAGQAASLTQAQYKIAQLYGFASWPKLKAHVDSLEEMGQLKQAIDSNDLESGEKADDQQPCAAQRSAGLHQKRPAYLGGGMPRSMGAAIGNAACHGRMDDRSRLRHPSGW